MDNEVKRRVNRYEGLCICCGLVVQEGAGYAEQLAGKWRVRHEWCAKKGLEVRPDHAEAERAWRRRGAV